MIGRSGKVMIVLYIVCLVVLFLMCSTDLIIREPERQIYQIAVIIEDVRSDNYSNFRKGMDLAAAELNADVQLITLYEKLDVKEQMDLMDREQQDGTDALIVVPVEEEQVSAKQMTIPVILMRAGVAEAAGAGNVIVDHEKMGELLAREILEEQPADVPVYVLTDPAGQSDMDRLFLKGSDAVFQEAGRSVQRIVRGEEERFFTMLEQPGAEAQKVVILAENQDILTEAAGVMAGSEAVADAVGGLYGRGTTMAILNYLDRGVITGICVTDEFSVGYYSVREAVRALEGAGSVPTVMESYYIEKKDLRDPAFEKMLFPIE
ncbi:MAG: substrate-binding domain-containing protein [Lachnospiraceae bacterium]|nr:substrate-binding domain-containing protein [Lachnospiraceae bacterium]